MVRPYQEEISDLELYENFHNQVVDMYGSDLDVTLNIPKSIVALRTYQLSRIISTSILILGLVTLGWGTPGVTDLDALLSISCLASVCFIAVDIIGKFVNDLPMHTKLNIDNEKSPYAAIIFAKLIDNGIPISHIHKKIKYEIKRQDRKKFKSRARRTMALVMTTNRNPKLIQDKTKELERQADLAEARLAAAKAELAEIGVRDL